jgi:hypothetical protein
MMIGFLLKIIQSIVVKLAMTGALSFMKPWLLKADKWAEDKLGIDIVKQDKKFHQAWPLVSKRLAELEKDSHPPIEKGGASELKAEIMALVKRLEELEKKYKK